MDVKAFNATFGTSYSESLTVITGCHEDMMGKGEVLIAVPRGNFVTFRRFFWQTWLSFLAQRNPM